MEGQLQSRGFKDRVLAKARQFLFVFGYVWLLLAIFGLHKSIVLSDEQIVFHQGFAILKALALAKVIFVAEELNVGKRFENRPLIWPVLLKSALFAALLLAFDLAEKAVLGWFFPRTTAGGEGIGGRHLHLLLSQGVLTFVALTPFFMLRELGRVFGEAKLYDLFFRGDGSVLGTGLEPVGGARDFRGATDGTRSEAPREAAAPVSAQTEQRGPADQI